MERGGKNAVFNESDRREECGEWRRRRDESSENEVKHNVSRNLEKR